MSATVATSLFWIVLAAAIAPLIAGSLRRKVIPEVVLPLGAGTIAAKKPATPQHSLHG